MAFDRELEYALELAEPGLSPIVSFLDMNTGFSGVVNEHAILNALSDNVLAQRRDVGPAQVASIERAWQLLIDFEPCDDPSLAFIKQAGRDFVELKKVSTRSPLFVVGLFSIIEMLLTTQQDKTTENSLSHQLKEKLTLFGNRFTEPMVLTDYFPKAGAINFKKFVVHLYGYRSRVAHGSTVDFTKGDLQVLQSHEAVCQFLRALVRKLILQAVQEPALFRDLKTC